MPRIGKGVPVAEGIWKYKNGYRVQTKVHGEQKERWYSEESDPRNLIFERAKWERERRKGELPSTKHSLRRAVKDYLETLPAESRRLEDATLYLNAWIKAFPSRDLYAITAQDIRAQLATWKAEDYAASTLNHRRQELKNLYAFHGTINPVSDVPKARERYDDARGQDPAVIEAIFAEMEDSDTRIRLRVIWETSLPHIDLTRLREAGFRPHHKTQQLGDRLKGAGVKAEVMSLTAAGVDALRAFYAAGLESKTFSNSSIHKSFTLAVTKAKKRWIGVWPAPENFHPYDLRHSRLTEALRRSKNLQGVQKLGRHKRLETTMRYVRSLESESARSVVEAMESSRPKVPAEGVKKSKIARKSRSRRRRRSE